MSKILQTRVQNKHDTTANWEKATNFIPLAGEIIVYDDLNQIKIGDGQKHLSELPFLDGKVKTINNIEPDENGNIEVNIDNVKIPVFSVVGTTLVISNAIQQAEGANY